MRFGFLRGCACAVVGGVVMGLVSVARGNHGPGASGGGSSTLSGETLAAGKFSLSLREDYSQFEHFSRSAAAGRAAEGGDFDALDHGFLTSGEIGYGLTDTLQLGAGVGYFYGRDFMGADDGGNGAEIGTANPSGMTDLVLTAKWRVLSGRPGNLSLVAGVILPTGKSDVRLNNGERLSPTDQPGTGRFGVPMGVAYSRFLTPHVTVDASFLYTTRFEKDAFKVGDRIDAGIALAWRLTDSITTFPQYSVFAELNEVYLMKDRAAGAADPNSGSSALYVTPGLRVRIDARSALTIAPSFPVWQEVNGDQGDVHFKLAVSYGFSF